MTAYTECIYSCYNSPRSASGAAGGLVLSYGDAVDYNRNEALSAYMKIDLSKKNIEVPCAFKYIICKKLADNVSAAKKIHCLEIPMLALRTFEDPCKSAGPLLKTFFRGTGYGTFLCKRKASDTMYMGGEGIIMYEDYTPLMMMTLELSTTNYETYTPVRQILRINPIIYSKTDIMAKHIRTTMISKLSEVKEELHWYRRGSLRNDSGILTSRDVSWTFRIIIEDFSEFFITPTIPDAKFSNADANEFLLSNLDDIIADMRI